MLVGEDPAPRVKVEAGSSMTPGCWPLGRSPLSEGVGKRGMDRPSWVNGLRNQNAARVSSGRGGGRRGRVQCRFEGVDDDADDERAQAVGGQEGGETVDEPRKPSG